MKNELILILDFGSQYSYLIKKRIKDLGVNSLLYSYNDVTKSDIFNKNPKGIILSGGPSSIYKEKSPSISKKIFQLNIPIFGICYGMQLISYLFGGIIKKAYSNREYGKSTFFIDDNTNHLLFKDIPKKSIVWMSHFDEIKTIPIGFKIIGHTSSCSIASIMNKKKNIFAVQFHPEVENTVFGKIILKNFVINICKCNTNKIMNTSNIIKNIIYKIKKKVKKKKVILAMSGGIDSFVTAYLLHKSINNSLLCLFIDTGLTLNIEKKTVISFCKKKNWNIKIIDAKSRFLSKLKNIINPEKKRKIIGEEFIKIFEEESKKINDVEFLAQGTIYSDIIESSIKNINNKKLSKSIKSHHNVGGIPKSIKIKIIEPLKKLFKNEIREIGKKLNIPQEILYKHPFPGPGLSIRIIGKINKKKIEIIKKAEHILFQELINYKIYNTVDQAFIILLPLKSVGVMGDKRSYEYVAVLRIIETKDFMTATFSKLSYDFLEKISTRIINEVIGINRILYDISSKPPSTIEWE